jgi:hypothetical protein
VFFQSLLGALVAGNDAGLVYNDWPLMNGALIPAEYAGHGFWGTIAHSQGAVQLHHRLMAYALFVAAIVIGVAATRSRRLPEEARLTPSCWSGRLPAGGPGDLDPDGGRAAGPGRVAPGRGGDPAGHGHHLRLAGAAALMRPRLACGSQGSEFLILRRRTRGVRSKNCHETSAQDVRRPCWSLP